MPSIPSISINTNTDSTFESSGGMTSRIRKKALESQISNAEQELEKLSAKQTAEKSKLKI